MLFPFFNRARNLATTLSLDFSGLDDTPPAILTPLGDQLQSECEAMARYVLQHGLPFQPELIARLLALTGNATSPDSRAYGELAELHRKLAHAVAPATPQAITLLDRDKQHTERFAWLGPVPLIRMLTLTALGFLFAVIGIALSSKVSSENLAHGLLDSSGTTLLLNMLFLLCCAGLGAAYATLFHAHRYVADCTYDPKYDASYGARLILGVIAGLILAEMLPSQLFAQGSMHEFGKPALSMLGGFSATAVHRLLHRIVETLETLVRGDNSSQYRQSLETHKAQAVSDRSQSRAELAAQLIDLQQSLEGDQPTAAVRQRLAELTRTMLAASAAPAIGEPTASAEDAPCR